MQVIGGEQIGGMVEHFAALEDPRSTINRKHQLGDLIVICILAVLAGADGPQAMGVWAKSKAAFLPLHWELPGGIPSHDTLHRLLCTLNPRGFQAYFARWIESLRREPTEAAASTSNTASTEASSGREVVAIDGKSLRRSHDRRRGLGPLHLVSAWSTNHGISLGQVATDEKSNEITAIPELLEQISLEGATVTIDAAGCQKAIAERIIAGDGDYVLALKGNQGTLYQATQDYVIKQMNNDFQGSIARKFETEEKGHGRIDKITYYQLSVPKTLPGRELWRGLKTIGVAIRASTKNGQTTDDVRYFVSSLPLGVKQFARAVRGHWKIENSLHWRLDVTFREDDNRTRDRHAAHNLAWLKRIAITLLKQADDKHSIAMRRRQAGWDDHYLAQLLTRLRV